ncbi:MAG: hypothetical protein RPU73_06940, partial [Candidatus Sedimenticola sp. (ex Thyasira tokunagai)]
SLPHRQLRILKIEAVSVESSVETAWDGTICAFIDGFLAAGKSVKLTLHTRGTKIPGDQGVR